MMHELTRTEIQTMIAHLKDVQDQMREEIKNPEDDTEWLTHEIAEVGTIISKLYAIYTIRSEEVIER